MFQSGARRRRIRGVFDADARRELLRLTDGLRRAIEASVSLSLPAAELSELADRVDALASALGKRSGQRPFARYGSFDPLDPNTMLPFSPVTGRYNALSPPIELEVVEGGPARIVGRVTFGTPYEGPPSSVHGSIIASAYDQVLAMAAIASEAAGPTATLTIHYRRRTPLHTPLRFEAWMDRIEGRKAFVRGSCHADGELVSEAEGLFVRFDAAKMGWARAVDGS
jgi:acyl-coenzyme A thioesterase PaaI-like protein